MTLSFFQYLLSGYLQSMFFRESVLLLCLLVLVLLVLTLMELSTRVIILTAGLFAVYKAVTSGVTIVLNAVHKAA
jgi:TRAP-type C4-dicarboxylate transport system permease large subunit